MNTRAFFRKWLRDVAADQTVEGGIAHVVPDILTGMVSEDWGPPGTADNTTHSATAWADVITVMPWTMYKMFGDKAILEERYENMKGWVDFMRNHSKDYIWRFGLQFGDWVALDAEEGSYLGATPNDVTCTAYFAYSTQIVANVAKILGNNEDANFYTSEYKHIVEKFQSEFFDTNGEMNVQTQTAHILALYFDLAPVAFRGKTIENLKKLLDKEGGHLVTGFVGTPYFCHALSDFGAVDEAYDLFLKEDFPSWLYQVKQGATTIWEHWDGKRPDGKMWSPDMNSFNHYAYGAVGEWMYKTVAGIQPDEANPGFKHFYIRPRFGKRLDFATASFESIHGDIKVHWELSSNEGKLQIEVPANTTATVELEDVSKVVGAGENSALIQNGKTDKNRAYIANVGSGIYEWYFNIS
jgi:alpha-L-rhamnosidase